MIARFRDCADAPEAALLIHRGYGLLGFPVAALALAPALAILMFSPAAQPHLGPLLALGLAIAGLLLLALDRRLLRGKQIDTVDAGSGIRQRVQAPRDSLYFVPLGGSGWIALVLAAFLAVVGA
jgi:hypothetical protein